MKYLLTSLVLTLLSFSTFSGTIKCPQGAALKTPKMPKVPGMKKYSQPMKLEEIDDVQHNGTFEYVCYYEGDNRRNPAVKWLPLYGTGLKMVHVLFQEKILTVLVNHLHVHL